MDRRPEVPEPARRRRPAAVGAVACLAVAAMLAVLGTGAWRTQRGWEVEVTRTAADLPEALRAVLWPAMQLGNRFVALGLVVVVVLAGRRRAAGVIGAAALGAYLASTALKLLVDRPRLDPTVLGRARWEAVHDAALPSTHTAIAVAAGATLGAGIALAVVAIAGPPPTPHPTGEDPRR